MCVYSGQLWASNCRLDPDPVKELSVSWLELMACLLLMVSRKLAVEKEVSAIKIFCWTDSQIVLWWIRKKRKEWKISVQNRRQYGKIVSQKIGVFEPTFLSLADICTRKCSFGELKSSLLWWNGPEFLLGGKRCGHHKSSCCQKNIDLEEKRNEEFSSSANVSFCGSKVGVRKLIDCGRFS